MNFEKYQRSIEMFCPTCGESRFENKEDIEASYSEVKCAACGLIISKDELIHANNENIEAHIDEIKEDLSNDISNEFKKIFKNTFKTCKHIKVR